MRLWHSTIPVGPWLTQAVGISSTASSGPALQLLVVPGNPGLCTFYRKFMEHLYEAFGGAVDVMAVSHVGHDSSNLNEGKVWCLDSQIQHKVQLLQEHVLAPGKPPAVIVAHSIGSFIMLQAVKQLEEAAAAAGAPLRPELELPKVVLLMPFLACDWSSTRQRVLRWAANFAPVLGAAAGAVGRLPLWLQDKLVHLVQPGVEPHAAESMKELMQRSSVYNNFHLACHEFRDLDGPVDWQLIRRLGSRAAVVCAPQDMWFPQAHYDDMVRALPGVEEFWHSDLTHAFCMESKQCQVVAELVFKAVTSSTQLLQQHTISKAPVAAAAAAAARLSPAGTDAAADAQVVFNDQDAATAADVDVLLEDSSMVCKHSSGSQGVADAPRLVMRS